MCFAKQKYVYLGCIYLAISVLLSACSIPGGDGDGPRSVPVSFPPVIVPSPSPPACSPAQAGNDTFVTKDGTGFLYHNAPVTFSGYTFYPAALGGASAWHTPAFTHYIDHIMDMGAHLGQNLVRPTDYWDQHTLDQGSEYVWQNLDYLVCAAQQRGIFVILDLSAFAKYLAGQGRDVFDPANWQAFLTAAGKRYKDQPSIAFYSILGEPAPPKNAAAMQKLTDFYRSITDTLSAADEHHHLISAGGFNHMEEETPDLPWWQQIYALPHNDVLCFKTYSLDDLRLIPQIAAYGKSIGKPVFDEEFGLPQSIGDGTFAGGDGFNHIKTGRAEFYQNVYTVGAKAGVKGFVFWDLGCDLRSDSYQVNPGTPATWQIIKKYASGPVQAGSDATLCT